MAARGPPEGCPTALLARGQQTARPRAHFPLPLPQPAPTWSRVPSLDPKSLKLAPPPPVAVWVGPGPLDDALGRWPERRRHDPRHRVTLWRPAPFLRGSVGGETPPGWQSGPDTPRERGLGLTRACHRRGAPSPKPGRGAGVLCPREDLSQCALRALLWPDRWASGSALASLAFSFSAFTCRVNVFNRYSLGARFSPQEFSRVDRSGRALPHGERAGWVSPGPVQSLTSGASLLQHLPLLALIELSATCQPWAPWRKRSV